MFKPEIKERIASKLIELYGPEAGRTYLAKLVDLLGRRSIAPRKTGLTEQDVVVIAYGDQLQQPPLPPLKVLHNFLKRYLSGLISTVHILPFFPYTSDDGFSVSDYRAVNPAFGEWSDVVQMGHDFRLMFDLVLNHTSTSCAWFQRFLRDEVPYRDYYMTVDPALDLSMVVRPRTHPLLSPFQTAQGTRHVWTTFSTDQVDLDYSNPAVLLEMIDILLSYVEQGADLIRLDAIAYLWKIPGTPCIHLAQTHRVVQLIRDVLDAAAPWVTLITETNVPHAENISYFGDGHDEAQMVYQFALPPLLVHTLQTGSARALSAWASGLSTPSAATAFFNFTASHDGIGIRPVAGLLSDAEIGRMLAAIQRHGGLVSYKSNPDGTQSAYEMNITFFDALSAPGDVYAVDRFITSQAIMLAMAGVPGIYLHSLLGSRNWHAGVEQTGRARTINREKLDVRRVEQELADPQSLRAEVFRRYADLLRLRRATPAFHPNGPQYSLNMGEQVFALRRTAPDGTSAVLCLHNVADREVVVELPDGRWQALQTSLSFSGKLSLLPYQVYWLTSVV